MKHCMNCGAEVDEKAELCVKCGANPSKTPVGKDSKFCANCGEKIDINAEVCVKCGVRQTPIESAIAPGKKSAGVAALLTLILLPLGYCYVGQWKKALFLSLISIVIGICTAFIGSIIIQLLAVYDVYKVAQGESGIFGFLPR